MQFFGESSSAGLFIGLSLLLDCSDDVMLEVRDHIEKVVETLVGDHLDESSVIRLANHPSCKYRHVP